MTQQVAHRVEWHADLNETRGEVMPEIVPAKAYGRLERAQFLHDLAGDRLDVVLVQMLIEPGEDRLVSAFRAFACFGEPASRRVPGFTNR